MKADRGAQKGRLFLSYIFLISAGVVFLYFFFYFVNENLDQQDYLEVPSRAEYTILREETITAQRTPIDYKFKTYYPPDIPNENSNSTGQIQNVRELETEPAPNGNAGPGSPMVWEKSRFLGTDTIRITYSLVSHTIKWNIDAGDSGHVEDIASRDIPEGYLGDQWGEDGNDDGTPEDRNSDGVPDSHKIEPSNTEVSGKAKEVVGNETNVYKMVYGLYRFMTRDGDFSYALGRQGIPSMAIDTLRSRRGDCDDQSILFISMLRSLGIPAWLEIGLLYDQPKDEWFGHAWTNVYIPLANGGYEVVAVDIVNEQFLFRTCNHMTDWTDDGVGGYYSGGKWVRSHLSDYYYFFTYHYSSQRQPKVSHWEVFTTLDYKPSGTVLYDTETGKSQTVKEIPFIDVPFVMLTILGISAFISRKGR